MEIQNSCEQYGRGAQKAAESESRMTPMAWGTGWRMVPLPDLGSWEEEQDQGCWVRGARRADFGQGEAWVLCSRSWSLGEERQDA